MDLMECTWYAHVCAFIDMKWANASPSRRRGLAEGLIWVTTAMVSSTRDAPDKDALRKALFHWSLNVTARGHHPIEEADVPADFAQERLRPRGGVDYTRSMPLRSFASPATVRHAMDAISVNSTARRLPRPHSPDGARRCSVPSSTPWSSSSYRTTRSNN